MPKHHLKILLSHGTSAQPSDLDKGLLCAVAVLRAVSGVSLQVLADLALYLG